MRRLRLFLLGFIASLNLLFWLLLGNHYQLKGFLLGYPNTVLVGSVALVLLAYLSASVRQTLPPLPTRSLVYSASVRQTLLPRPARSLNWRSLWRVGRLLVLLILGGWFLAVLLGCLSLLVWQVLAALQVVLIVLGLLLLLPWGYLFAVLTAYVGSVLLFQGVARVLHKAALPKPVALLTTTLAAVSLGLAFAWIGGWGFFMVEGYAPSCSQRFVSPSGQRTLVLESRDDWIDGDPTGYAYVEASWWRRELPAPLNGYNACTDASLRVRWSADEKQVNWQTLNGHGQLQF